MAMFSVADRRLLIVEDDPVTAQEMAGILSRDGYAVDTRDKLEAGIAASLDDSD